jgi:hypothetical protein
MQRILIFRAKPDTSTALPAQDARGGTRNPMRHNGTYTFARSAAWSFERPDADLHALYAGFPSSKLSIQPESARPE